ncbi:ABC transporter substrate-binding protein [Cystobacter fuscus]|uniref:ABC transporter substrate-binding protein n=1 Tax=Cystobacter fuscus TaxID=43 RepID=UPI002B28089C|nr:ABC transporter substrate-binding protein [Cystobacter fuscus]
MRALWMTGVLSVLASGCSFISAAGLDECETSADCGSDRVCTPEKLCLPLPVGCGTVYGSQSRDAIPIGGLFPVHSGPAVDAPIDESDEQALNAAVLAVEQINQRSIGGKQFALYFCDTGNDVGRAQRQAEWLVKEKKVPAMITAGSSQTLTVAQSVAIAANVVTMSYSATSPEVTDLPDKNGGQVGFVWRTSASDAIQGSVIANLLRTDARFGAPKRVGIFYVNDPYGQGLFNIVSERLDMAPKVDNEGDSYTRQGDVKAALDTLNQFDPDLTVLVGFASDVTNILTEAATRPNLQRSVHKWLFSDSVKDVAVLANGTASAQAQGFYGTAPAQGTGQAFRAFQSSFKDRFNKDPSAYAYTSNAYDAMYLLALGAAYSQGTSGAVTGPKLAEGLTKVSSATNNPIQLTSSSFTSLAAELAAGRSVNVDGASGALDFNNDTGEAPAPVELWQVVGNNFATIETIPAPKTTP